MLTDDLSGDAIQKIVAAGIYWVPTLELWKSADYGNTVANNLKKFIKAGGRVALGMDYDGSPIFDSTWECL